MGFLDFFRKEEEEPEKIAFEDLPHWLDDFLKRKDLDERFEDFKAELKVDLDELKDRISELEDADLMNPDIPEKHKQIMQGNRERYVQQMRRFGEDLELPEGYKDLGYFASDLSETIADLEADTSKNFHVLKEFFEDEVKKIASKVKEINDRVKDFREELEKEDLNLVREVKLKLKELSDEVKRRKSLEAEKREHEEHLEELEEKKQKILDRIEDLKNSSEYEDFKELHERKREASERIDDMKKDLSRKFSTLERALKKYTHNTPVEKFVQDYLDAPDKALLRDDDLEIVDILEEIGENIPTLGLKDRKEDNTLAVIDDLDESKLSEVKKELEERKEEVSDLTQQLKGNVTSMNITEQEEFLKNVERKIEDRVDKISDIENKLERINIGLLRQKIKKKAKGLADLEFEE